MRYSWICVALAAFVAGASVVFDVEATQPAADNPYPSSHPQAQSRSAVLWENNGCTGDNRSVDSDRASLRGIFHDEARSLTLIGPPGTTVSVYDANGFGQGDDYALIVKEGAGNVCVRTFETGSPRTWVQEAGYRIWYTHGGNLDGKVSSIRFDNW